MAAYISGPAEWLHTSQAQLSGCVHLRPSRVAAYISGPAEWLRTHVWRITNHKPQDAKSIFLSHSSCIIEPQHDKNNKMTCAASEGSDQSHLPSQIRVFAVRMKKAGVLSYPLSAQRRHWSVWGHSHIVGFVMRRLISIFRIVQRTAPVLTKFSVKSSTTYLTRTAFMNGNMFPQLVCYRKTLKIRTPVKIAVIILQFEQCCFTLGASSWENKTCFCHMRATKAPISLRIRAVWSAPLLFAP